MKALRWFTLIFLVVLLVATLTPVPAYAQPAGSASASVSSLLTDLTKTKLAKVRMKNHTGGVLSVRFSGPYNYSFSTSAKNWTSAAVIQPGKYVITITSSACGGSYTLRRNVKGGTVGLPTMVCRHKK